MSPWRFLLVGYLATVLIEAPVLWFGLARRHPPARRIAAAVWLTACSYPLVVLTLGPLMGTLGRPAYLAIAETLAPAVEVGVFLAAWGIGPGWRRDVAAIVLANLASFAAGELWWAWGPGWD